jgi:hypothetical protein
MKAIYFSLLLATSALPAIACAQATAPAPAPAITISPAEQQVVDLSAQKWLWMSERNVEALDALFDDKAVFVHMGGSMTKAQELGVISGGMIQYTKADIESVTINIIDDTAIVLSKLRLLAVVGGNEVTNPFMVTEVYVRKGQAWKLGSLSFTRLMGN